MVSVTSVNSANAQRTQELAQQIVNTYNKNKAAGTRMMREAMQNNQLSDADKKTLYQQLSSDKEPSTEERKKSLVGDVADDLGKKATGKLEGGDPNGGEIDTQQEYDQVVNDMAVIYQKLGEENPAEVDAAGKPVIDGMPGFSSEQAKTFSADVMDGIQIGPDAAKSPDALGRYGQSLLKAFGPDAGAGGPNPYFTMDPKTGEIVRASPVLGEATAFSLNAGSGNNGVFSLKGDDRTKLANTFTNQLTSTESGDLTIQIDEGDTWLKVFGRKDVQEFYLSDAEKQKLGDDPEKCAYYLLGKYGKTQGWDMNKLGDKNGDGNYVEGQNDPDLARTGSQHTLINDAGQKLKLDAGKTKDPVKDGAKDILGSDDQVKAWKKATSDPAHPMDDKQKAALERELMESGGDISKELYREWGYDETSAEILGNRGGLYDDTGMTDGTAIYKAYREINGDPARFKQWMKDIAGSDDGKQKLKEMASAAQSLMQESEKGTKFERGDNSDGNRLENWFVDMSGMNDPGTLVEYVSYLKYEGIDVKFPLDENGKRKTGDGKVDNIWDASTDE